ncbi:hypothetical protein ACKI2N_031295 [Cupriavidus sp. 30B13]|uniref:hypothetical protein n=1 Tax=Cupriavidus sp. 30B13 TaxID=3384241 RepID=UPI003B8FBC11
MIAHFVDQIATQLNFWMEYAAQRRAEACFSACADLGDLGDPERRMRHLERDGRAN